MQYLKKKCLQDSNNTTSDAISSMSGSQTVRFSSLAQIVRIRMDDNGTSEYAISPRQGNQAVGDWNRRSFVRSRNNVTQIADMSFNVRWRAVLFLPTQNQISLSNNFFLVPCKDCSVRQ